VLIDGLLRDRGTAIQSGPSDMGLFGATPETFQNWSHDSVLAMSIGSAGSRLESQQADETGYTRAQTVTLAQNVHLSTSDLTVLGQGSTSQGQASGSIDTHVDTGITLSYMANGSSPFANGIAPGSSTPFVQSVHVDAQANTQVAVETSAPQATADALPNTVDAAQTQVVQAVASIEEVHAAATAQLEQLSTSLASEIAALKAQTDAAIAELTSEAAEQVAAVQQAVSGLVEPVAALPGALAQQVDAIATSLVPPVLDTIASLPGAIGAATNVTLAANVAAEVALGGHEIGVELGTTLSTATALDIELLISGSDIAGGVSTLLGMLDDGGYVIEDAASGIQWLGDAVAPLDTVAALADADALDLPDTNAADLGLNAIEPGAILLGIADHGSDLLGGLSHLGDHGHG
jgi:hypothetical protein